MKHRNRIIFKINMNKFLPFCCTDFAINTAVFAVCLEHSQTHQEKLPQRNSLATLFTQISNGHHAVNNEWS